MKKDLNISAIIILIFAAGICLLASIKFLEMSEPDVIYPNKSLTKIGHLSDYNPHLINTNGDSDIYFFESDAEGATVMLLGGTHPNEPSGFITAVVLIENISVDVGRAIIIPQACLSGFFCTDPMEGCPQSFEIKTEGGTRKFRFGSRVSNPLDQWPDPLVYSHYPSGQKLSGFETRNLNRSYPGRANGTFTEKVGYAILEVINSEKVDIAFDLHEAAPEIPIINAIVYHEKAEDIAMNAIFNLSMEDLKYAPELSPENFRGLSHREWGDNSNVFPFLMETSNPIQGRLRGKTNSELILTGYSPEYYAAQNTNKLRIEYEKDGEKFEKRVARHIKGFSEIINAYNELYPEKTIVIRNIPGYSDLVENGLGKFLNHINREKK
jgi:hypothetical protein